MHLDLTTCIVAMWRVIGKGFDEYVAACRSMGAKQVLGGFGIGAGKIEKMIITSWVVDSWRRQMIRRAMNGVISGIRVVIAGASVLIGGVGMVVGFGVVCCRTGGFRLVSSLSSSASAKIDSSGTPGFSQFIHYEATKYQRLLTFSCLS
ncbi:hypothetical protein Tco_0749200 [Tanacetum coccineum]|uniref:Uncharacterized protein n=1 Tax=Tanacetum coccineum TaxID=301880 RepID=A0ABQ4YXQ6_9ASTR